MIEVTGIVASTSYLCVPVLFMAVTKTLLVSANLPYQPFQFGFARFYFISATSARVLLYGRSAREPEERESSLQREWSRRGAVVHDRESAAPRVWRRALSASRVLWTRRAARERRDSAAGRQRRTRLAPAVPGFISRPLRPLSPLLTLGSYSTAFYCSRFFSRLSIISRRRSRSHGSTPVR
jgi:hypothetical protein